MPTLRDIRRIKNVVGVMFKYELGYFLEKLDLKNYLPFNKKLQEKIKHITPIYETILITISGPQFSTLAEGQMYTALSANLINMTTAPEAKLAAELGTPYTAICTITDYDSYVETKPTNINIIKKQIKKNNKELIKILKKIIEETK